VPRYVQVPALRHHGRGPRNLFWGAALLVLALALLVVAIFFVGAKAMLALLTCLLTFTALFVLARAQVFRQRNGGFVALALVCLIGALVPLAEQGYAVAKGKAAWRGAGIITHTDEAGVPLLSQSFALSAPEGDGKQVSVLRDSQVVIGGKPFLIKAGDRFPLVGKKDKETLFAVRDLQLTLPSKVVEIIDPKDVVKTTAPAPAVPAPAAANPSAPAGQPVVATPDGKPSIAAVEDAELAEITRAAQQEAMRRYPALAIKDSLENGLFVSTYKQLRDAGSDDFFADPRWPVRLADMLAKRAGWIPGGPPMTTGPAPILDPPAGAEPPAGRAPVNVPPVNGLDAGAGLPGGR
jgi:hypothetical protein